MMLKDEPAQPPAEGVEPSRVLSFILGATWLMRGITDPRWAPDFPKGLRQDVLAARPWDAETSQGKEVSVLLEGGGKLAASFLREDLIDRIEWFRAPVILGGDGRPALATLELAKLADAPRFKRLDVKALGDDLWERYERLRD
jgi:hypothetical protein